MAIVYVDPQTGNDTTGSGTIEAPYATRTKGRQVAGAGLNQVLVKRGSVETVTSTFQALSVNGLRADQPFIFGVYGDVTAGPAILRGSGVTDLMYVLGGAQYIEVRDWWLDAESASTAPLNLQANTADVTGLRFVRCRFSSAGGGKNNFTADGKLAGFKVRELVLEDCQSYGAAGHGYLFTGDVMARAIRCKAWGNGATATAGAHGFSALAYRETLSSWSGPSGNVYSKATANTPIKVTTTNATYPVLANGGATATPTAGQFGYTAGTLYINLNGANPASYEIKSQYTTCGPILWEDCDAFGNIVNPSAPYIEGTGFQLDDFATGRILRSRAYDNQGGGFVLNSGDSSVIEACIAERNGRSGVAVTRALSCSVRGVTSRNNARNGYGSSDDAEIRVEGGSTGTSVKNCLIDTTKAYGVTVDAQSTSSTVVDYCDVQGATTAPVSGVTATNSVTTAPSLDGQLMPQAAAVQTGGTYLGGLDYYGKEYQSPPSIGAVQYQAPRAKSSTVTLLKRGRTSPI